MTLLTRSHCIESTKLQSHDYGAPGYYFVTLLTKNRVPWFGKIINAKMQLSDAGRILWYELHQITRRRPIVIIDEWIILPDRFLAIVQIRSFSTTHENIPQRGCGSITSKRWKNGCLGNVINPFKMTCTKQIRGMGHDNFAWQPSYHDSVIRDDLSLHRIRRYIQNNSANWRS